MVLREFKEKVLFNIQCDTTQGRIEVVAYKWHQLFWHRGHIQGSGTYYMYSLERHRQIWQTVMDI